MDKGMGTASAAANKRVVMDYLSRLSSEGQASAAELATSDATWWIQGDWPLGGTYRRQQLMDALAGVTSRFRSLSFDIHNMTAEDDRVCVDMSAHGEVNVGEDYRNTYHLLFVLDEAGKITQVKEFTDTKYANEFFFPSPHVPPVPPELQA